MDRFWEARVPAGLDGLAPVRESSEMVDWLVTLQLGSPEVEEHAVARWDATRSLPWLVARSSKWTRAILDRRKLLEAAAAIPETSPAHLTLTFNRARLLLLSGKRARARDVLNHALASPDLPASSANMLKAARLLTARTLGEFLQDAARTPILEQGVGAPAFDDDSIDALNEQMPLELLQETASHRSLPPSPVPTSGAQSSPAQCC